MWDLFSSEAKQVENTYNASFRIMYSLPRENHRFFVEPISGEIHLKKTLIKRFLNFIESIKRSKKIALKNLFYCIKGDCRSITGRNLANIAQLVNKVSIDDLVPADSVNIEYNVIPKDEEWRLSMVDELTSAKFGEITIDGFTRKELDVILSHVCCS